MVPHVECYPLLRDWLLSSACHGAGYMLVLHVVLVYSRKRLVAKRRLSWRSIQAHRHCCLTCIVFMCVEWNMRDHAFSLSVYVCDLKIAVLFVLAYSWCPSPKNGVSES